MAQHFPVQTTETHQSLIGLAVDSLKGELAFDKVQLKADGIKAMRLPVDEYRMQPDVTDIIVIYDKNTVHNTEIHLIGMDIAQVYEVM